MNILCVLLFSGVNSEFWVSATNYDATSFYWMIGYQQSVYVRLKDFEESFPKNHYINNCVYIVYPSLKLRNGNCDILRHFVCEMPYAG